jgi:uncharacterized membrane protein
MTVSGHLWAIGYDRMDRAEHVRAAIARLGESRCLVVLDTAVAVRYPDGSFTLDGEPFVATVNFGGNSVTSFLAGLALAAPPLTGAAAAGLVRSTCGAGAQVGIDDPFVHAVRTLMRPETSALFVLDQEGDLEAILRGIRGLGGTVLKTNVDVERARLIQSTLAARANQEEGRP